jgi:hypothetical protein
MDNQSVYFKQNGQQELQLLIAQRLEHSAAKRLVWVGYGLSIFLASVSALMLLVIDDEITTALSAMLAVIAIFTDNILQYFTMKHTEKAASIQQTFDVRVFGLPLEYGVLNNNEVGYAIAGNVTSDTESVKNWYSDYSALPPLHEILCCQSENIRWDDKLRRRFRKMAVVLWIIIIFAVLVVALLLRYNVAKMLSMLTWILPLLQVLILSLRSLTENIEIIREAQALATNATNLIGKISDAEFEKLLIEIQLRIFNHRRTCEQIPDWFYSRFRSKDQTNEDNTAKAITDVSKPVE